MLSCINSILFIEKSYKFKLKDKFYDKVINEEKTILMLLKNRKTRAINIGAKIIFINDDNKKYKIQAEVIDIAQAKNFASLVDKIDYKKTSVYSKADLQATLADFFPLKKQNKQTVLSLEFKKIV